MIEVKAVKPNNKLKKAYKKAIKGIQDRFDGREGLPDFDQSAIFRRGWETGIKDTLSTLHEHKMISCEPCPVGIDCEDYCDVEMVKWLMQQKGN